MEKSSEELYDGLSNFAKIEIKKIESKLNKGLLYSITLIFIMILTIFILLINKPESEYMGVWFQRSGSLIVVISLFIEIKISFLQKLAISQELPYLNFNIYLRREYEKKLLIANYTTFLFIIIGTIIWGYGDLLFKLASY